VFIRGFPYPLSSFLFPLSYFWLKSLGHWYLDFVICLEFDAWNLGFYGFIELFKKNSPTPELSKHR